MRDWTAQTRGIPELFPFSRAIRNVICMNDNSKVAATLAWETAWAANPVAGDPGREVKIESA